MLGQSYCFFFGKIEDIINCCWYFLTFNLYISVPKCIFLKAAEFNGWLVRLKNYKHGHKNIFGPSVILELKVENNKILTFKAYIRYLSNFFDTLADPNLSVTLAALIKNDP